MAEKRSFSLVKDDLIEIFGRSQHLKNTQKCVKDFMKHYKRWYNSDLYEDFMTMFIQLIKSVLISDRSSPFTKRTLDFLTLVFKDILVFEEEKENQRLEKVAANIITGDMNTSCVSNNSNEDIDELCEAIDFDQTIIDTNFLSPPSSVDILIKNYFVKFLNCENVNIRNNTASLIRKILDNFNEIDENTYEILRKSMTERSFDRDRLVRAISVLSLCKLQDAWNKKDVVLNTLTFHLANDPDFTVRSCALRALEMSSESIQEILLATRDINQAVRRAAFNKISELEVFHFTPQDRYKLLKNGSSDGDPIVKDIVFKKLITSWINRLDNNIVKFLEYLNIKNDLNFYGDVLMGHFSTLQKSIYKDELTNFHKLVFDFKNEYLDEYNLFTKVGLTEENTFLWHKLCAFCKKNNITFKREVENTIANMVEDEDGKEQFVVLDLVDQIMPDIPVYCDYIEGFVNKVLENLQNSEDHEEKNFIFTQLLNIGKLYKIKDIAQWNRVLSTFKNVILNDDLYLIFENYIEEIITIFSNYFEKDDEQFLNLIYELINSINHPEVNNDMLNNVDYQTELKNLDGLINEKYELRSHAIMENNIERMSLIKTEIDELIEQKQKLIESQMASEKLTSSQDRMETDSKILERCIYLCYSFLHVGAPKKNISLLPALINRIILPNLVFKESEKIRLLSIKAFGNYCFASCDKINHFLKVFIEIIEEESYFNARVEALKFLFDFVGYYGTNKIQFINHDYKETDSNISKNFYTEKSTTLNSTDISDRYTNFTEFFCDLMLSFLNEPSFKLSYIKKDPKLKVEYDIFDVCVKGLCKILALGRLYSGEFLARLIVIYTTYKNIEESLRQFIKGFFYIYSLNFDNFKDFFNIENPFLDAYVHCFKQLSEDTDDEKRDLQVFETANNIIMTFVPPQMKNKLVFNAMEIFDISDEKELLNLNLKLISRIINFNQLQLDELKELKTQFDQFSKRYTREIKSSSIKTDKVVTLTTKLLNKLKMYIKNLESKCPKFISQENSDDDEENNPDNNEEEEIEIDQHEDDEELFL